MFAHLRTLQEHPSAVHSRSNQNHNNNNNNIHHKKMTIINLHAFPSSFNCHPTLKPPATVLVQSPIRQSNPRAHRKRAFSSLALANGRNMLSTATSSLLSFALRMRSAPIVFDWSRSLELISRANVSAAIKLHWRTTKRTTTSKLQLTEHTTHCYYDQQLFGCSGNRSQSNSRIQFR